MTEIGANFVNNSTATISVNSGELEMGRTSDSSSHAGSFEVASGAFFGVDGNHDMMGASSFTGDGGFRQVTGSGTTSINGNYALNGPLEVKGGTLVFPQAETIDDYVSVTGGMLEFMMNTPVTGNVTLSGGTLTATDLLSVALALLLSVVEPPVMCGMSASVWIAARP